jgi:ATP adenylyltransferase
VSDFDELVSKQIIIYDTAQSLVACPSPSFPGFPLAFIVTNAFLKKPQYPGEKPANTRDGLLPGSDINMNGFEICDVGERHFLGFNMFCAFRPHLMILTKDGHKRQFADLEEADVAALWTTLVDLGNASTDTNGQKDEEQDWVGIYNCGKDGGCSRLHRHMQLFPMPPKEDFRLFPDLDEKDSRVPFKFFIRRFATSPTPAEIFDVYVDLLTLARAALGIQREDPCPHNLVLTKRWMVIVPRRHGNLEGLGVNAIGMMGLIIPNSEVEYQEWKKVGPEKVVAWCGAPPDGVS